MDNRTFFCSLIDHHWHVKCAGNDIQDIAILIVENCISIIESSLLHFIAIQFKIMLCMHVCMFRGYCTNDHQSWLNTFIDNSMFNAESGS